MAMFIFIHGTGDDDKKTENWMPWLATILELHGHCVLVLPGVASSDAPELRRKATAFMNSLFGPPAHIVAMNPGADLGLVNAIQQAGGEITIALAGSVAGQEQNTIDNLCNNQRHEDGKYATGIKLRIAVGALCAFAHFRRRGGTVKIIGHSRGGAAAVGLHNVLSLYSIPVETLTLDPCHGVKKFVQKEYFHHVWAGTLTNIPCEQEVGDTSFEYTFRPPITRHGTAAVTNYPKLRLIKHGHMGKLRSLAGNEIIKQAERWNMVTRLSGLTEGATQPLSVVIQLMFTVGWDSNDNSLSDKKFIAALVYYFITNKNWRI